MTEREMEREAVVAWLRDQPSLIWGEYRKLPWWRRWLTDACSYFSMWVVVVEAVAAAIERGDHLRDEG